MLSDVFFFFTYISNSPACPPGLTSSSALCFFSSSARLWLSCCPPAARLTCLCGPAAAKLMNGYMVLTNGGTQPRSSPSVSSHTLSRPAGDIIVNMDMEPSIRKMDTIVKLDAVSLAFSVWDRNSGFA